VVALSKTVHGWAVVDKEMTAAEGTTEVKQNETRRCFGTIVFVFVIKFTEGRVWEYDDNLR